MKYRRFTRREVFPEIIFQSLGCGRFLGLFM
jgi:hypothetical protein